MPKTRLALLAIGLLCVTMFSVHIYRVETNIRTLNLNLIELSKAKYGLFNVDEWKEIVASIITAKVEDFDLDASSRSEVRKKVTVFLTTTIDKIEGLESKKNDQKLFGFIANAATNLCLDKFREKIPTITEDILDFLNDPENRRGIKSYLIGQLNEYASSTFSRVNYEVHDAILQTYGYNDRSSALIGLASQIEALEKGNRWVYYSFFLFFLFLCVCLVVLRNITRLELLMFLCLGLIVLSLGLLLPMIDVDARISEMSFQLLGVPVIFENQVLYFKSKSILEVVQLMFSQGKWDLIAVGVLVLVFSVLFPLSKLICSVLMIYKTSLKNKKWARFIVFKTGKWSMADVMVIVIFMAYIGFSGILTEQLSQIERITAGVEILTTNHSSLRMGFFMFTCFVLLSLLISERIAKSIEESRATN